MKLVLLLTVALIAGSQALYPRARYESVVFLPTAKPIPQEPAIEYGTPFVLPPPPPKPSIEYGVPFDEIEEPIGVIPPASAFPESLPQGLPPVEPAKPFIEYSVPKPSIEYGVPDVAPSIEYGPPPAPKPVYGVPTKVFTHTRRPLIIRLRLRKPKISHGVLTEPAIAYGAPIYKTSAPVFALPFKTYDAPIAPPPVFDSYGVPH